MSKTTNKLLLRWCLGIQDTTRLADFNDESKLHDMLWLAKLSIVSFQRWFPEARFMLFYNGDDFEKFRDIFEKINVPLTQDLEYVDQISSLDNGELQNPYHYVPQGVWYKWIPFRYDIDYHEVSIDTDIICIGEPHNWYEWLSGEKEIIVAPERFSKILVNTCGDFAHHPVLAGQHPLNCGIVGHRAGCDYSERFFDITKEIDYGQTQNSLFITEQGAINVWAYSLQAEGVKTFVLNFERCSWMRDFVYYLEKGVPVETVHATMWHKRIVKSLGPIFERRIREDYDDMEFLADIIKSSRNMEFVDRHVVGRQLGDLDRSPEFFF